MYGTTVWHTCSKYYGHIMKKTDSNAWPSVILTSFTNSFLSVWSENRNKNKYLTENTGKYCWEVTYEKKWKLVDEKLKRKIALPALALLLAQAS